MFTFLTAGESHGKCLTAIIEGVVSGLSLNEEYINAQLKRRQVGFGRGERMKIEEDKVEITSGVRQGKTLGSPITLVIKNKDWENWKEVMSEKQDVRRQKTEDRGGLIITTPRPGHADLAGLIKYQQEDIRNILERSSARETAVRSAVGAVAKRLLEEFGLEVLSWVSEIGGVRGQMPEDRSQKSEVRSQKNYGLWTMDYGLWTDIRELFQRAEKSILRCPDKVAERKMIEKIKSAKREGDTLGGIFEVVAIGAPVGLGSYVHWERRLDGRLARALMSIPAIKGVEIGLGFALSSLSGSEVHDEIFYKTDVRSQKSEVRSTDGGLRKGFYRKTNSAGGLEGGVTNGEPIILRAVMKPISTLGNPLRTVDFKTKKEAFSFKERADICALPSASVVGEAVVAIELAKVMGEKFAGDSLAEMKRNFSTYLRYVRGL